MIQVDNSAVNYNFDKAPNPPGYPGELLSPEQRKYHAMAELRRALNPEVKDYKTISRLKNAGEVTRADINFNYITDPAFKTQVEGLFNTGGRRRRKTRKPRRKIRNTRRYRK